MDFLLSLKHILVISLLSTATYCCKAQQADSVQIVARAALCFDNQTVTNTCTRWMRRIANMNATAVQNSNTLFCSSPCFGQMILVLSCVDGILSNFQFYSPGLMQGVQSIFQMSCGGRTNSNPNASASGNMVAEATEAKEENFVAKLWSSIWIILLAFAATAALILYISQRDLIRFEGFLPL